MLNADLVQDASRRSCRLMSDNVRDRVQALGDEIRDLKAQLKEEGLSAKEVNNHPDVQAKVAELRMLKLQLDKGDSLTDEAFKERQKQEKEEKERARKAQMKEEKHMLESTEKALEMPLVQ